ncbi:hypothetical protein K474DRAFT_1599783 [Panus rudis PR-1116 ss-1]|nr:hypothetical protein K474DRAFT_1599783 [Panus rudis PR-1116 ss-1]
MSSSRAVYAQLSSSSPRPDVARVLHSIIDAPPFAVTESDRKELIQLLLDDLALLPRSSSSSRLSAQDAALALLAVKTLGKLPAGSAVISSPTNLAILLGLATSLKDNVAASNEALRCIANALLLVESARSNFLLDSVGGGNAVVELLVKASNPERIFLASRILFLSTVSTAYAASYIVSLVEGKPAGQSENIVDIIGAKLDSLLSSILLGEHLAREATVDLLKAAFNFLAHYPKIADDSISTTQGSTANGSDTKVLGDYWNERLDGFLPPLLKLFNNLPSSPTPLSPPISHVIHALIAIPVTPSLRPIWFPQQNGNNKDNNGKSHTPKSSTSKSSSPAATPGSSSPVKESKPGAFDRALSKLSASRRSLSRSSSPHPPLAIHYDTVQRAYELLDATLSHYLPGAIDPDEPSVREQVKKDADSTLDDTACPLVLLIGKLCSADENTRRRMRQWVIPDDLDRTSPLETRADLLGRLLRLLSCVHHPRLKDATGEMLYSICDSDASTLASFVGYGNVAGFLFNKGIMSAPPPPSSSSSSSIPPTTTPNGVPIDPITGVAQVEKPPLDMTDEEKEAEAEKLFVLFDRLEKSGAIPPSQNPIRKAIAEGKLN